MIEQSIGDIQAEIEAFNQGHSTQPAGGTAEWFRLRALVLGLTFLQRAKQLGVDGDPAASERLYRACYKAFNLTELPPAAEIVREVVPT